MDDAWYAIAEAGEIGVNLEFFDTGLTYWQTLVIEGNAYHKLTEQYVAAGLSMFIGVGAPDSLVADGRPLPVRDRVADHDFKMDKVLSRTFERLTGSLKTYNLSGWAGHGCSLTCGELQDDPAVRAGKAPQAPTSPETWPTGQRSRSSWSEGLGVELHAFQLVLPHSRMEAIVWSEEKSVDRKHGGAIDSQPI